MCFVAADILQQSMFALNSSAKLNLLLGSFAVNIPVVMQIKIRMPDHCSERYRRLESQDPKRNA